jgi:hypothetical protein
MVDSKTIYEFKNEKEQQTYTNALNPSWKMTGF